MSARMIAWIVFASALAAAAGLWLGSRAAPTESDVITAGAQAYVREEGGDMRDCVGVPGEAPVWIEVICGEGAASWRRAFDRQGRRVEQAPEG